jgi:hypothetical protein
MAYRCDTFVIEDVQNVRIDHRISIVGIRIDGLIRLARITAGIWPTT